MSRTKKNRPKNTRGYRFSVKIDKFLKEYFTDDGKIIVEKLVGKRINWSKPTRKRGKK